MNKSSNLDFEVKWLPYQLNPAASEQPSDKTEMYMKKFGKSREQVAQMAQGMAQKFAAVGLPFRTEPGALVSNTLEAHRVLAAAYQKGAAAQDKAMEVIFHGYFAEGKAPNDAAMLQAAATAAGLDAAAVASVGPILDRELKEGRGIVTQGVPHFVIRNGSRQQQFSGAYPSDEFLQAFASVTR